MDEQIRLEGFAHELRNLLDGSMRCLMLARQRLGEPHSQLARSDIGEAQLQLDIAVSALERMAGLVHAAMQGPALAIGSALLSGTKPATLSEVVAHALAVTRPAAEESRVVLRHEIDREAGALPAGAVYTVVLNGLRNAVESAASMGGGHVMISAAMAGTRIRIRVEDDGVGLSPRSRENRFVRGFTTKRDGAGLGLALCRDIVESAGGSISLENGHTGVDRRRPGAVLEIEWPVEHVGRIGGV